MAEDINGDRIRSLERRDWQLWAITLTLLLSLATFIVLIYFYWGNPEIGTRVLDKYEMLIFLLGFTAFILLFCGYMVLKEVEVKRLKSILVKDQIRISTLKKVDEMKSDFVSMVGHELKSPLTTIKNAVDIIQGGKAGEVSDNQKRFLFLASRNVNRLSGLINDLLDISRIESGKVKIKLESLDVNFPLNAAVSSVKTRAEKKSIAIHKEIPSDLPRIYGDPDRVEQVFINLLDNAIKFTPQKGQIRVLAKAVRSGEAGDKGFVEISVADNGIGIPPDELGRIFDRFYQVEKSGMKSFQKGTGLGLAICKGIVEAHHGQIKAESEWGKGTTIAFYLPQYEGQDMWEREPERMDSLRAGSD